MKGFGAQWKHLICFKYVCHFSWPWLMFSWERFVTQVRCWPEGKMKNLRSVGVGEEGRENRKFQARSCFIGKINAAGQQSQSARSLHPGQKCPSPVRMARRLGWLELGGLLVFIPCAFLLLAEDLSLWSTDSTQPLSSLKEGGNDLKVAFQAARWARRYMATLPLGLQPEKH